MGRTGLGLMLLAAGVSAALTWLLVSGDEGQPTPTGTSDDAERIAQLEDEIDRLNVVLDARLPLSAEPPRPADASGGGKRRDGAAAGPPPPSFNTLNGFRRRSAPTLPKRIPPGMRGTPKMWLTGMRIALEKGDTALARYYQMALTALGDEAIEPTAALLGNEGVSEELRQHAAQALARLDKERLSGVALAWLSKPREPGPLRTTMVGSISAGAATIPKPVVDLAWDPDAPKGDRRSAILALTRADPDEATRILRRMLRDEGDVGHRAAVNLLAQVTDARMRPLVSEEARESEPNEQRQLLGALAAMKGRGWDDTQMTGAPDTPIGGDNRTAWASKRPDEGPVTIELEFLHAVVPEALRIHETFNPGALARVEALIDGRYVALWTGTPSTATAPRWFAPPLAEIDERITTLRLTLDTDRIKGWNEIDAVELVGDGRRQWAQTARSSSSYGRR